MSSHPMSSVLLIALGFGASVARADSPKDTALIHLSEDRVSAGVRVLRGAVRSEPDDAELRCLLGRALRVGGDEAGAVAVLAAVPAEASCGARAAFERADALVALGRPAEAAALYAQVGAPLMGPDRDRVAADDLVRLAQRIFDDPERDDRAALGVLRIALGLRLDADARLDLAVDLAHRMLDPDGAGTEPAAQGAAADAIRSALLRGEAPDALGGRLLLARLLPGRAALGLLAPLAPRADIDLVRAQSTRAVDATAGRLAMQALMLGPAAEEAPDSVRLAHVRDLIGAGWVAETDAALASLGGMEAEWGAKVQAARVDLAALQGDEAAVIAACRLYLERFPTGRARGSLEARLRAASLQQARRLRAAGDRAGAMAAGQEYLAVVAGTSAEPGAVLEMAAAAHALGDGERARSLWSEIIARWPSHAEAREAVVALARQQAFDQDQAAAAIGGLRKLEREGGSLGGAAGAERARLSAPAVHVASAGRAVPGKVPTVQVMTRNVDTLNVKLHRIDAEAFVRSGGSPDDLPSLDVAVVAPDREWTAQVPTAKEGEEQVWEMPVRVPGPGLYSVTVGTAEREARAILLVSDVEVLSTAAGDEVVVAVLRKGRPAAGARVVMVDGAGAVEGRADARGLWRGPTQGGDLQVLAVADGAPALMRMPRPQSSTGVDRAVGRLELERNRVLPGDWVGFRYLSHQEGQHRPGNWRFWLKRGAVETTPVSLETDRRGALVGELRVPRGAKGGDAVQGAWQLMVRAPGEASGRAAGSLQVVPDLSDQRQLEVWFEEGEGVIELREPDGLPVAGVVVSWTMDDGPSGKGRTDDTGRLRVPGPPEGMKSVLRATVAGSTLSTSSRQNTREMVSEPSIEWKVGVRNTVARPGEEVVLDLSGEGAAQLLVRRVETAPDPAEAPEDPWLRSLVQPLEGPEGWTGTGPAVPDPTQWHTVHQASPLLSAEGSSVTLPPLPEGDYTVSLVAEEGAAQTVSAQFRVDAKAARVQGLRDVAAGETLRLRTDGAPVLVTASQGAMLRAGLLRPGQSLDWTAEADWHGPVVVTAFGVDGPVHSQTIQVDASLSVALDVSAEPGGWRLRGEVQDASGKPVAAQVSLSAIDALVGLGGQPSLLRHEVLHEATPAANRAGGRAASLRHGTEGRAVSAALLAESRRESERRKMAKAEEGRLGSKGLERQLEDAEMDVALEGLGSIGTSGRGGSGYGAGSGGLGSRGSGRGAGGIAHAGRTQGWHGRALWEVVETDAAGAIDVLVPGPPVQGRRFVVRAQALADGRLGTGQTLLDQRQSPTLILPPQGVAGLADTGVLRVGVLGVDDGLAGGRVRFNEMVVDLPEARGGAAELVLGNIAPGTHGVVVLEDAAGNVRASAPWSLGLDGGHASDQGRVLTVAAGPGGGLPLAWLAGAEDPAAGRLIGRRLQQGLAWLAVFPHLRGAEAEQARQSLLATRDDARLWKLRSLSPGDAASLVRFLVGVQDLVSVPRGDVEAAAERLDAARSNGDRVHTLLARAEADLPVDDSAVARLVRDAPRLSDEEAGQLARALILLKRPEEAKALIRGGGPEAVLARMALGQDVSADRAALVLAGPPAVGAPGRSAWIQAVARAPGRARGSTQVSLRRRSFGAIDAREGGVVRTTLPSGLPADWRGELGLDGLEEPLVLRGGDPVVGLDEVLAVHLPEMADGWVGSPAGGLSAEALPYRKDTEDAGCGGIDSPCRVGLGDAISLRADLFTPGFVPPAGLELETAETGGWLRLRAVQPGQWTVRGAVDPRHKDAPITAPLVVEVSVQSDHSGPLAPEIAVRLAEQAVAAGEDPSALLAPWPEFDQWSSRLLPTVVQIRFDHALGQGAAPATLVARFEDLRDGNPRAAVDFDGVVSVAQAYAAVGRHGRAVDVWRAGLGIAFLDAAAPARQLEDATGRLSSLKAMRALSRRYPVLPMVEEAVFLLPEQLGAMADAGVSAELQAQGITEADIRLLSAAWDREFLALHPGAQQAPEAGFHLVQGLFRMRAFGAAADWAARLGSRYPDHSLLDGFVYLEALGRAWTDDGLRAAHLLERLVAEDFPQADGSFAAAAARDDARYALARLADAQGRVDVARAGYEQVQGMYPEARRALADLNHATLVAPPLTMLRGDQPARLAVELENVDTVHMRAYRLDLRTVFLRDRGLSKVQSVQVGGVSPVWSGKQRVDVGAFGEERTLELPLRGSGAWLVQLEGGAQSAQVLLVRSNLQLEHVDDGNDRRVVVRRAAGGQLRPADGVQIRAIEGGEPVASETDLRGVATVSARAAVLAFDGDDVAFSDPGAQARARKRAPSRNGQGDGGMQTEMLRNMDTRLDQQRARNEQAYEQNYGKSRRVDVEASAL